MTGPPDPFEILRGLNPVDPADVRGAASSRSAADALEEIVAGRRLGDARGRRRIHVGWPRRRRVYVLAILPLAILLTAAAWALTRGSSTQLTVGCYASADLHARTVIVPAGDRSPIKSCRVVWERGDFGTWIEVPGLQACVLPSGVVGVFPSPTGGTCRALRLKPVAPEVSVGTGANSVVRVKNALVRQFLSTRCLDEIEATATIRAELRKVGIDGWSIKVEGAFGASRPCASLAFDEAQRVILVVPIPRRP